MKKHLLKVCVLCAACCGIPFLPPAAAQGHGGGGHGGGGHGGGHGGSGGRGGGGWHGGGGRGWGGDGLGWWGLGLGLGLGWEAAAPAYPYYYPYPAYDYPQAGYAPPVNAPITVDPGGPDTSQSWYYCESARDYYPRVTQCQEGWRTVPVVPPGVAR